MYLVVSYYRNGTGTKFPPFIVCKILIKTYASTTQKVTALITSINCTAKPHGGTLLWWAVWGGRNGPEVLEVLTVRQTWALASRSSQPDISELLEDRERGCPSPGRLSRAGPPHSARRLHGLCNVVRPAGSLGF